MIIWPDYPLISLISIPLLTLLLMYLVRAQAHGLVLRCAKTLHGMLRLASRACLHSEHRIRLRNHEVTKALAEALMERQLERRFMRIEKLVERDLANYQILAADINQQLATIDEDYESSAEVPSASPDWIAAVEAIAALKGGERNSEVMSKILAEMHGTVQEHQREVMREHRWSVSARHRVLSGLRQHWRKLSRLLEQIDNNVAALRQRLHQVDMHMSQFEMVTAGSAQGIMASMFMRFVTALCFVMVGVGAVWVNLQLMQAPIAEVLAQRQIGGLPLAAMVAGLHIAITLVAATMISESLRITHLFPLMAAMTKRGRISMIWVGTGLLVLLATIEALALAGIPLVTASVGGVADIAVAESAVGPQLAGASQLVLIALGIIMPVILALVVIPLEYLLHTVRPVMGSLLRVMLHVAALVLRLVGSFALNLGKFTNHCYDVVIFVPLALERDWVARRARKAAAAQVELPAQRPELESVNVTALRFGSNNGPERH